MYTTSSDACDHTSHTLLYLLDAGVHFRDLKNTLQTQIYTHNTTCEESDQSNLYNIILGSVPAREKKEMMIVKIEIVANIYQPIADVLLAVILLELSSLF